MNWKRNWQETQSHFRDWWQHRGLVLHLYYNGHTPIPHEGHACVEDPGPAPADRHTNARWIARSTRRWMSQKAFFGDTLPMASPGLGPGSLAACLGSEIEFAPDTVWFHPSIDDPDSVDRLRYDPEQKWWKIHEVIAREMVAVAGGDYFVGNYDLVENLDVLASLRGTQNVLFDLVERPDWVKARLADINQVYREVYQRIYDIIKLPDGSSGFGAFSIWGDGKAATVQCDISAMLSPQMFDEFVLPGLREQCAWLDHALYHLDGTQALVHLDSLLSIPDLHAIEWTPQLGIEGGGKGANPRWFDLYRKILNAGKSVWVMGLEAQDVVPLLDAIGPHGVYIELWNVSTEREFDDLQNEIARRFDI